ncbi:MAG: DUF4199 domain-containing protein [Candidatus Saccharimonadaceae bacterium]
MHKEKNSMVNFAMQAGLALGGFWVFKYIFIIASSQYPALGYVNTFLSIMTPVILLFYLIKFKNETVDNKIGYWQGVKLGGMLFLFASLIESIIIIAHIVWIDPTYISTINQQMIELAQSLNFNVKLMDEVKRQSSFSPMVFILKQLSNNVFIGFILSLMLTPVSSRININK